MIQDKDFAAMSWQEYQEIINCISDRISGFCNREKIKIDFILPILRGGGIPAISISHKLNVKQMETVQIMHDYANGTVSVLHNSLHMLPDKLKPYVILLVDDYHASGKTVYQLFDTIISILPNAKIMYVSLGRDVAFLKNERDFLFTYSGFISNECDVIPKENSREEGILTLNTLFPWEDIETEIENLNNIGEYI